jgi:hypothetical protein
MKLVTNYFLPFYTFYLWGVNSLCTSSSLFSDILCPCSSGRPISCPYKSAAEVIAYFTFIFLERVREFEDESFWMENTEQQN